MANTAGSDDGSNGDASLPSPPKAWQKPPESPSAADERVRGCTYAGLALAAGVVLAPLLIVLLFIFLTGDGFDEFAEEEFRDADPAVLDSFNGGFETGFAQRINQGIPNVFEVTVVTDGPTTVVALNPSPSEPNQFGMSTQIIVQGDVMALGQGEQYTLSTTEDCVLECTIEFTVVDPVNFHVLGSNVVVSMDWFPLEQTRWFIDVDPGDPDFLVGNVCLAGISANGGADGPQFVSAYPAGLLAPTSHLVNPDQSALCQAEFTIPLGGWLDGVGAEGLIPFEVVIFGPEVRDIDFVTIELS